ncbi:MAG: SRPBCC domain-containing protein [Chloroflexota bacterium]|mgnify:CR=1 FL=1|nr:SRPBCC domain-containing protein [Chloroflexota bacterium]
MQVKLKATPERIFVALTDSAALKTWFAADADVSVSEGRYDFWGKYTPDNPDREAGRHKLIAAIPNQSLRFAWRLRHDGTMLDTEVEYKLVARGDDTLVTVQQREAVPVSDEPGHNFMEDVWFLHLENLRRYLAGKPSDVRIDFSESMLGDVTHTIDIDAPAEIVFDVLIKPEQLNRWIASRATVDPRVGGEYDYGWGDFARMKILELEPNKTLKLDSSDAEHSNGVLTWTLEESGGKTRLTMVHSGFAPDTDNSGIYKGWWNFLNWIRGLAEEGAGWQPPLLSLKPELQAYYAASIWAGQAELIV